MKHIRECWALLAVGALWMAPAGWAQAPVNVLQDCWTSDLASHPDPEWESFSYTVGDEVTFVWKHKIQATCSNYLVDIVGLPCIDGKPPFDRTQFEFRSISFGRVVADPAQPEKIFQFTAPPGSLPPGRHDWLLIVECDDTDGIVHLDSDVDDECGINVGITTQVGGPLILGPEPVEIFNASPGGTPAGRRVGEEGTTRPWCFEVTGPDTCAQPFVCDPTLPIITTACSDDCFCLGLAEGGGVCAAQPDCATATPCPNGTSDCPAGEVCLVDVIDVPLESCCDQPVCGRPGCGQRLEEEPPGLFLPPSKG